MTRWDSQGPQHVVNSLSQLKTSTVSLLFAVIVLVSCNDYRRPDNLTVEAGNSEPDTVKPIVITSIKSSAYPDIFEAAFVTNTKVKEGDINLEFYKLDLGKIRIESGRLIACDPVVMHDALPFAQHFPIGEFAVHLAMAKSSTDERVAFSRIMFSENTVAKWEFALHKGQKPIPLGDTIFYCFGVDAGTAMFIDSIANQSFAARGNAQWENVFITKAEENAYKGFIYEFDRHNLATFSTGYGDGCYATFIGFDSEGEVCQLLTDFGLVGWWKNGEGR